jgi:pimeloyl-ACP methyl ester carboxylesterase
MKSVIFIASLLLASLLSGLQGQSQAPVIDTGRIDGVMYRIIIPENWNHNLVMYAHGYMSPDVQNTPQFFHNPRSDQGMQPFLERGFAVARSAYSKTGWALVEGVDDTEALRMYFFDTYGKPDTCFVTGHSMGGGITLATEENLGQYYQGAMPMCPLAGRPYLQTKLAFDMNAVFSVFYPGVLPALKEVTAGHTKPVSLDKIQEAIAGDTLTAAMMARRYDLKTKDLAFVIMFNDGVIRDISGLAGANPFDNTNTLYSGFDDDWTVNQKVERLAADPQAEDIFEKYDRTGNLVIPTLLVHTIYDQLITPSMAVAPIDNLAQKQGKKNNLVVLYTKGQGHCNFTSEETGKAFDILRQWVHTGKRPRAGILQ